jgi:integrase
MDALGSLAGATAGGVLGGPQGAVAGALVAPLLAGGLKEMARRALSQRADARVHEAYEGAILAVREHLDAGDRITYEDVASWVSDMATEVSPSTTRQAYHLLTSMLDQAVKGRRLPSNPASGVELPRLPRVHKRYLSHEQVTRLAEECGDDGVVVLTLAYTGIRWGELAAIRVGRVAPGVRRIHIAEAMSEVNGKTLFGPPKTHADRWVAVPRFLRESIGALMAGKNSEDLLFTSPRGEVLRVHGFRRRAFDRAAASLGLSGLVPHELRHTAASLAIASGANVKAVQSMLGHASAAMTLDRYSHLFDDALDTVADRLDEARSRSAVPPSCPQGTVTPILGDAAGL